ncbi:acyltransferase family protein [Frondihabitans sucicola]|nr:acyltransferase family protein [Frondihabitans sucicola]
MQTSVRPVPKRFRPDIQGLRMLAVVAVILDHLLAWPSGGFVGVDVFFVLSGFLITGLLYREHQKTGRISFAGFYRRRARRILPISALVLAVTVATSFAIFLPARAKTITVDALWSLLFAGNWHFAAVGTNYFASDGTTSPLQHYWSLAVEEQFYLVWPWILVIVFAIAARRSWSRQKGVRAVVVVMVVLSVASLVWAILQSVTDPGFAYFSTLARAWELGVGALLAIGVPILGRIPDRLRPILAWVGLAGIVLSVFVTSGGSGFPAPGALLPVLSTALVVAAGTGGEQRYLAPLTNRVSNYVGDISYSLYLWHFPVIILLGAILKPGVLYYVICLVGMAVLSMLSYHLVEDPIRNSTWLDRRARQERRQHPELRRRRELPEILWNVRAGDAVIFGTAIIAGLVFVTYSAISAPPPPPAVAAIAPNAIPSSASVTKADTVTGASGGPQTTAEKQLSAKISTALTATSFPAFDPPIDSLGTTKWVHAAATSGCADISADNATRCETGPANATKQAVVLGDSFAIAWMPGLRTALADAGYRVHTLTSGQCPAADVVVDKEGGAPFPECTAHRAWALQQIAAIKPDLVVLADSAGTIDRLATKTDLTGGSQAIANGLQKTIQAIKPHAKRIAVLSDPPAGVALQECVTRVSTPSDCVREISPTWSAIQADDQDVIKATGATYVDTHLWFCDDQGRCPSFIGNTPVRADAGHMTVQYSESLEPLLAAALKL